MQKKRVFIAIYLCITSLLVIYITTNQSFNDFCSYNKAVLSYYGSRGQEVINIQTKLKNWGYYNGKVDGIYGYQTYKAVRSFQYKNDLKVDGIAGPETLSALGLPTGQNVYSNDKDVNLLAHLIHGEARGEPYTGQVAVAAVVLNRINDSRFPNSIASVIYQPGAFTAVADGQINLAPNSMSYKAARDALNGWDPTYNSIYYFNPSTATSKWIWSRPFVIKIGKHRFCK